jgi:two-component system chemotaxis response regulator CheB
MMVRTLVVDDSVTARALIVAVLKADPGIEIVGQARNAEEALELARKLRPDVITMDFQMPGIDGFEATRRIMTESPCPIVIVSGSLDVRDVVVSMEAMRAGALAILAKPPAPIAPTFARESRTFANTVKAMSQVKTVRRFSGGAPRAAVGPLPSVAKRSAGGSRIVGIAASTGGPAALHRVLTELPPAFPAPILIVQHIAIGFAEGLAAWLDRAGKLRVKLAAHDERLEPGVVYLAPDDRQLGVRQLGVSPSGFAQVIEAPPVETFRPSGTYLFDALAASYGASAIGVVLTGMGNDGAAGLAHLHDVGGTVIAQDESSSVVFGMPRAAIQAGSVDSVLPLEMIAGHLQKLVVP